MTDRNESQPQWAKPCRLLAITILVTALPAWAQNPPATTPAVDDVGGGGRGGAFSPVVGITLPSVSLSGGRGGGGARGARGAGAARGGNVVDRLGALRAQAVAEVGEDQADNLMEVWESVNEVQRSLDTLNFGGMLRFGHVLNRWVARPMVPFPEELTADEKKDWRPFIFQARTEEAALNLIDIQGMRMYEGWGAKMIFQRVIEINVPLMRRSITLVEGFEQAAKDDATKKKWDLLGKRLEAATLLLQSADHMVSYQAHLDRVRALKLKPDPNPPLGTGSDWARTDMMELARKEIDTVTRLRQIIMSTPEPILDTAPTPEEETIMRLGPNIADHIKKKIDVMNAHWRDYDRIFSVPNP